MSPTATVEKFQGWETLSHGDKGATLSVLKKGTASKHQIILKGSKHKNGDNDMQVYKARKLEGSVSKDAKPNKGKLVVPRDSNASSAGLHQSDTLWKLKDELKKHVSIAELRAMLEANKQYSSGRKRDLLERCADGMLFGALGPCPVCTSRLYCYRGHYQCSGYVSEWSKCTYTTTQTARIKKQWKIPDEIKSAYLMKWFKSQKVKKRERVLPPMAPQKSVGQSTHQPLVGEALDKLRISIVGLSKDLDDEWKEKLKLAGTIFSARVTKDINCLVSCGGLDNENPEVRKARRRKIPIVRGDYLGECIKRNRVVPFDFYLVETTSESSKGSTVTVKVKDRSAVHEASSVQNTNQSVNRDKLPKLKRKSTTIPGKPIDSTSEVTLEAARVEMRSQKGSPAVISHTHHSSYFAEMERLHRWNDTFATCGLVNLGNSCYIGSAVQCLAATKPLKAYLLTTDHKNNCSVGKSGQWCILCELHHFINEAQKNDVISPEGFVKNLKSFVPNFGTNTQEDSHELFVKAILKMQTTILKKSPEDVTFEEESIISWIFAGHLRSRLICTTCGNVSDTCSAFTDINVEITKKTRTLDDSMELFTAVEKVESMCEKCKINVINSKQILILEEPNILCIHFKRYLEAQSRTLKVSTVLDLHPYMCFCDENITYDLYAMIVHLNQLNTGENGHYVCYVKGPEGLWRKYDDDKVTFSTEETVCQQNAYMLLYRRRSIRPKPFMGAEASNHIKVMEDDLAKKKSESGGKSPKLKKKNMAVKGNLSDSRGETILEADIVTSRDELSFQSQKGSPVSHKHDTLCFAEMQSLHRWNDTVFTPCGLVNIGNSSYVSVAVQCLAATKPLRGYLLAADHKNHCSVRKSGQWCFLCELHRFISGTKMASSLSLKGFIKNLKSFAPHFGSNMQEKSHQFFTAAVQEMQSAILKQYEGREAVNLHNESIISWMFYGHLRSRITCKRCANVSDTYIEFTDIGVSVKKEKTLDDALRQFTSEESVDHECDKCKFNVKATRQVLVHEVADILCIHLKKFKAARSRPFKVSTQLQLHNYMSFRDKKVTYELYAMIVHLNPLNTANDGHYICYIKVSEGRWCKYDDEKVTFSTEETVCEQKACMLLYSRKTIRPKPLEGAEASVEQLQKKAKERYHGIIADHDVLEYSTLPSSIGDRVHFDCTNYTVKNLYSELSAKRISELKQDYIIVEDMERPAILHKIDEVLARCDRKNDKYYFRLPSRGEGSCVYEDDLEQLCLRRKDTYVCPSNIPGSLQRARQIWYVLNRIRNLLQEETKSDMYGVYYEDIELFGYDRDAVDRIISLICSMLECTRFSLNITPSSK
ncbi:hypothetical protein ACQ4PT_000858 [Festuca glaucescens]